MNDDLTAAEIRIAKDMDELYLPECIKCERISPLEVTAKITAIEGPYSKGVFNFRIMFKHTYPFTPPRVKCTQRIFHPNIDINGNVCLNILRLDWSPVLSLTTILLGLLQLFLEPSSDEPLNQGLTYIPIYHSSLAAGELLRDDLYEYNRIVKKTMFGGTHLNIHYDKVIC